MDGGFHRVQEEADVLRRALIALVLCVPLLLVAQPANADVTCPPEQQDPQSGTCLIGSEEPGRGGDGPDGGGTPVDQPGGDKRPTCTYDGEKVPCTSDDGVWDGDCYVKATDPQPPMNDPLWQGNTEGLIVTCTPPCLALPNQHGDSQRDEFCVVPITRWAAALAGAPDPAQLAERAVAEMALHAIDIGIVPEEGPDRVGIVGMPQWMWVNEPAPNTFGPITRTATAGTASVTATASVDKVVWDMGDGSTVTCVGPGTPYEDRFDLAESPDCGYRYTKQGRYEVTATSYWTVAWEGMGRSDTIPLEFTATANIVMGEAQVITQ